MDNAWDCIELVQGDIVEQDTDAIVNAANRTLLGGGGVDGAIHRAAGPKLYDECLTLGGCNTGDAKITQGYKLSAKYVIHTVGPIYKEIDEDERLLASAYRRSLEVAVQHGCRTVAFPSISTGAYGYPLEQASIIALQTIQSFLKKNRDVLKLVRIVLFGKEALEIFQKNLDELSGRVPEENYMQPKNEAEND